MKSEKAPPNNKMIDGAEIRKGFRPDLKKCPICARRVGRLHGRACPWNGKVTVKQVEDYFDDISRRQFWEDE